MSFGRRQGRDLPTAGGQVLVGLGQEAIAADGMSTGLEYNPVLNTDPHYCHCDLPAATATCRRFRLGDRQGSNRAPRSLARRGSGWVGVEALTSC